MLKTLVDANATSSKILACNTWEFNIGKKIMNPGVKGKLCDISFALLQFFSLFLYTTLVLLPAPSRISIPISLPPVRYCIHGNWSRFGTSCGWVCKFPSRITMLYGARYLKITRRFQNARQAVHRGSSEPGKTLTFPGFRLPGSCLASRSFSVAQHRIGIHPLYTRSWRVDVWKGLRMSYY
jgi:hypothetical protein